MCTASHHPLDKVAKGMAPAASTAQEWLPKQLAGSFQSSLCSSELQGVINPIAQTKAVGFKEIRDLLMAFFRTGFHCLTSAPSTSYC